MDRKSKFFEADKALDGSRKSLTAGSLFADVPSTADRENQEDERKIKQTTESSLRRRDANRKASERDVRELKDRFPDKAQAYGKSLPPGVKVSKKFMPPEP